jgi:lysophospholipid acyltransferase (LPLAT)-like uncharacterized protein
VKSRVVRRFLGVLLGFCVRAWVRTLRLSVVWSAEASALSVAGASAGGERPWVLAFFHGQQFALLAWPRRPRRSTLVLVSLSEDGDLSTEVMSRQGLSVVRGSSSRGGARGLTTIVRRLRAAPHETDVAFAVDGPRGPLFTVHPGALAAARHAGGLVVPLASAAARSWRLGRAWDRFEIPWPFSRVAVAVGRPLDPAATSPAELSLALHLARADADRALGLSGSLSMPPAAATVPLERAGEGAAEAP